MKKKRTNEIFRDSRWLIIKPLTLAASIKYGYNSKWCTSSKENPLTFYKYSKEGILLYIIERKTDIKWAVFWEIDENGNKREMSWWNAEDDRLDSMLVAIPDYIMSVIKNYIFLESKPNLFYLSEAEKISFEKLQKREIKEETARDWSVYRNDGVWHQSDTSPTYKPVFDVDEAVRNTLESKCVYEAHLNVLKQLEKTKEEGN
tara:strand:- start:153 stop:761 length:609 start_codon:yes stop_codon:yes gene_type:complete